MINNQQLQSILVFLQEASASINNPNNEQHCLVYNKISQMEEHLCTYFGLSMVLCGSQYQHQVRYMAGLTMNSCLKRNPTILSIDSLQRKQIRENLLHLYRQLGSDGNDLLKVTSMVVNQLMLIGGNIDYQLLNEMLMMLPTTFTNFIMFFQDLKCQHENYQVNDNHSLKPQFTLFVTMLFQKCLQSLNNVPYDCTHIHLECANLMVFYLTGTHKLLLHQYLSHLQSSSQFSLQQNNNEILQKNMEGFEQIAHTKPQVLLDEPQCLQFIYNFHVSSKQPQIMKLWCEILMELFQNEPPTLEQHCSMILQKLMSGCVFTQQDLIQIKDDMQLEYNPYQQEQAHNNYEMPYGKCGAYTLRRVCIMCIQKMSSHYPNLWQRCRTKCAQLLQSILTIGILAETNIQGLMSQKGELLPYLLEKVDQIKNTPDLLKATTYYTLEKLYTYQCNNEIIMSCLSNTIIHLSTVTPDNTPNNTVVIAYEAAISLLDQLLTHLEQPLPPQLQLAVNRCLITCLNLFTGRPLYNTFKAITSVFENQVLLPSSDQTQVYIQQLCIKWVANSKVDSIMCPLIETMVIICERTQSTFYNFAVQIFQQLLLILKQNNERKALLLRCMDLMSAIIALKHEQVQKMVIRDEFASAMLKLIRSNELQIRHFGYAVLSDIAKVQKISAHIHQYLHTIINSINKNNLTSTNNALLCLMDLLSQHPEMSQQYTNTVLNTAITILNNYNVQ